MRTGSINAARRQADHHARTTGKAWCVVASGSAWLAIPMDSLAGREPVHAAEPEQAVVPAFVTEQRRLLGVDAPRP